MFKVLIGLFGCMGLLSSYAYSESLSSSPTTIRELQKVVVISRHGVRSPTQSAEKLQSWSDKPWPSWGIPAGNLSSRGYQLILQTWQFNKKSAPFVYGVCPKPGDVKIIADVDERTIQTAKAINEGLYPNCGYSIEVTDKKHSSLFSPLKAKVCKIQEPESLATKLTQSAQDLGDKYQKQLDIINRLTGKTFSAQMQGHASKHKVGLSGPEYDASSMTEIFALEWGQWPQSNAAWGQLDWSGIKELMPLRVGVFSVLNRDMEVARYKGSALAEKIIDALSDENGPRYTFLVGHDTNLANLGALFELDWALPGRVKNENTPGGYLKFEKWLVNDQDQIRISYSALEPEQIHADNVTKPVAEVQILPEGTDFNQWKSKYSRHILSRCVERSE